MKISIDTPLKTESKTLSPLQEEYRKFFKARLMAKDKKSPFDGTPEEIADFFMEISEDWNDYKASLSVESTSASGFADSNVAKIYVSKIQDSLKDKRLAQFFKGENIDVKTEMKKATDAIKSLLVKIG